jgi:hypothetical protein
VLRPALKSEDFFRTVFGLQRDSVLIPGNPAAQLAMAPVVLEYENWLPGVPIPARKALLKPLALLGRILGYKAGYSRYSKD